MTNEKILWIRLQKILSQMAGASVSIHQTTDMNTEVSSVVKFDEYGRIDIVLNLNNIKEFEGVIIALAHEMTHVMETMNEHSPEFSKHEMIIKEQIMTEYEKVN